MDGSLAYDMSRYNFTEETWRTIFAYESKLRSHKLFKKVNFDEGEKEAYISWIRNIVDAPEFERILFKKSCMYDFIKPDKGLRDKTLHYKLEMIFNKNKYWLPKVNAWGMKFSYADVCEFLQLAKLAIEYDCIEHFISIPDVWYVAKNVRKNWGVIKNIARI